MPTSPESDGGREEVVEDLGEGLCGLVRLKEGPVCWIQGAVVPGDQIRARIDWKGKRPRGELLEVTQPSPDRQAPPCSLFGQCGGCDRMHLHVAAQQRLKMRRVRDVLERIGGLASPPVNELLSGSPALRYRNKLVLFPIRDSMGLQWGLHGLEGGRKLVALTDCLLAPEWMFPAARQLSAWLDAHSEWVASVRGLTLRQGDGEGERAALLTVSPGAHGMALVDQLKTSPTLVDLDHLSVRIAEHPTRTADHEYLVKGSGMLTGRAGKVELQVAADAFMQVNPSAASILVERVLKALHPLEGSTVLDLFCGSGFFSFPMAAAGARVVGFEGLPVAVKAAEENASRLGLADRTRFQVYDLRQPPSLPERVDALVLDPPRSGLGPALLAWCLAQRIPRIVYVSCDPATLARDVKELVCGGDYELRSVTPVDLFPQTRHVESVAVLHLRSGG